MSEPKRVGRGIGAGDRARYGLERSNAGEFDDRTCFPAQSSVLDEQALLVRVAVEYDISPPQTWLNGDYKLRVFARRQPPLELMPYAKRLVGPDDYAYLTYIQERTLSLLEQMPRRPPQFGLCHGDLVLSNVRRADDGSIWFFDFGNACFGWRAGELAAIHGMLARQEAAAGHAEVWDAFLRGYSQLRPLPADLAKQLKRFALYRKVGWVAGAMASCPLRMGTETFNPGWVKKQMPAIRELAAEVLGA